MDPITILNLTVAVCLAAERIFRRFERYLETRVPLPTNHLEMAPPQETMQEPSTLHRRPPLTINIPARDLKKD